MIDDFCEQEWDRAQGKQIRNCKVQGLTDYDYKWLLRFKGEDMVQLGFGVEIENLHYAIDKDF